MSFSRELKDFASGFGSGVKEGDEIQQGEYYRSRAKYYDDRSGGGSGVYDPTDESGHYKGELDPEGNPVSANPSDYGAKPQVSHSMLYNAGQWIKKQLGVGTTPTTPTGAQQKAASTAAAINEGGTPDADELYDYQQGPLSSGSAVQADDEPSSGSGGAVNSDEDET